MKMKNGLKILILVVSILLVASIIIVNFVYEDSRFNNSLSLEEFPVTLNEVNIEIKKDTLTKSGVTIIITNNTDSSMAFDEGYRIDKREDGQWSKVKTKNKNTIIGFIINEVRGKESIEEKINWSKLYGTLRKGNYRIVKEIYGPQIIDGFSIQNYIAVEFTIK